MHNIDTMSVSSLLFQLYFNIDMTLSQRSFNMASSWISINPTWILCLRYICPVFSILKIVFNIAFNQKYQSLCYPSVYDALKYFTETVTPRTFSKIILSHSFLFYSSFCVNIFFENFLLFASRLAMSQ